MDEKFSGDILSSTVGNMVRNKKDYAVLHETERQNKEGTGQDPPTRQG